MAADANTFGAVADAPIEPDVPVETQAAAERPVRRCRDRSPAPATPLSDATRGTTRRGDSAQRQAQPQGGIEEYVDRLPDLSPHKRAFLKQYPHCSPGGRAASCRGLSRCAGAVRDDTPEMDQYILENVSREIDQRSYLGGYQVDARERAGHHEANVGGEGWGTSRRAHGRIRRRASAAAAGKRRDGQSLFSTSFTGGTEASGDERPTATALAEERQIDAPRSARRT